MQTPYKGLHSSPTNIGRPLCVCVCTCVKSEIIRNLEFYGSPHCVIQAKVYTNLKRVSDEEQGKVSVWTLTHKGKT